MSEEELYKLLNIPNKPWIELNDEEKQLFEKNNNYIKQLQQESNNLNKGIDELIEKVEKEIIETTKQIDLSICPGALVPIGRKQAYETFLEDLKSLKGE